MIKDSGERRQFDSGAVRDIQEGKGRCDLLPLSVVSEYLETSELRNLDKFMSSGDIGYLFETLSSFKERANYKSEFDMMLEVSKHFEEGAKKYGEYNWQKGISVHCYIDSAVRHFLKYCAGWTDEPHDRAFIWNILCCVWTVQNKPELIDIRKGDKE